MIFEYLYNYRLKVVPIIDIYKRKFRRSFPLAVDYTLLENTKLYGDSPIEELQFADHHLIGRNPVEAVVSLLTRSYTGTEFRVSPKGGLITSYLSKIMDTNAYHFDKFPLFPSDN
jgi:hypothetical protein